MAKDWSKTQEHPCAVFLSQRSFVSCRFPREVAFFSNSELGSFRHRQRSGSGPEASCRMSSAPFQSLAGVEGGFALA